MADKGILNNRGGQIRCSAVKAVLEPGKNRVTDEQLRQIQDDKFLKPYWDDGTLVVVSAPPVKRPVDTIPEEELGNDARGKSKGQADSEKAAAAKKAADDKAKAEAAAKAKSTGSK